MTEVALAHDYLTQRGGAERVVVEMAKTFPGAPLYTSLFEPSGTFADFADIDVHVGPLQRVPGLRRFHRLGLPLYALATSRTHIDADTVVCSSSGWAHGVQTDGRKVGYLHAPARWLHQPDKYTSTTKRGHAERAALAVLGAPLRRWDREAVDSLDLVLCNSTMVAASIERIYGRTALIVPPPPAVLPGGTEVPLPGWEDRPDMALCVARFMPYKNVDVAILAARSAGVPLVVVGHGPDEARLRALIDESPGGPPIELHTDVSDAQLRWLYRHASVVVAVAYEDYGLTPLEAASFGRPTVALRAGGYLDTVQADVSGLWVDSPDPEEVARGLKEALAHAWDPTAITEWAARFSPRQFRENLRAAIT